MEKNKEPMIKLEPGGKAPILSYNLPESTSYSGQNFIEMELPESYFKEEITKKSAGRERTKFENTELATVKAAVENAIQSGFSDRKIFPNVNLVTGSINFLKKPNAGFLISSQFPISPKLAQLDPEDVARNLQFGKRLNIYRSMFGTLTSNYIPEPEEERPRLLLIEKYRLSSYLGNYGAGRTIKTFSLLPGEKTRISFKSYTKKESDASSASSIFDSFTQASSDEFETSVQSEQSNKQSYAENYQYNTEVEASAAWGWGRAKVSGGVKGGSNSAREEFAKNISSATEKHAASASAKRDIQVNTSYEIKEQTGEETSIEREIQNINLSRTLNFVFRQMNQEFITLLHLVDIRVAFFNGFGESRSEVSLPELDNLLEEVIDEAKREEVRKAIIEQLQNIFDYKDLHHSFVEEKTLKDQQGKDLSNSAYLRVKKDYTSIFKDDATETEITVPGIILSSMKFVLRTDGIIVEALLGHGNALDRYSQGLQDEALRSHVLNNDLLVTNYQKNELGKKIVEEKDEGAANIYALVFPPVNVIEIEKDGENA
ncbi:MAG: hypothetical protein K0B37_04230 [Bacteroidales bacterium]|nr:hypothetical protein [Bacteroidales bacterium]